MEFRIVDTFTDSLARLTGDEQKAVKTTAFDLQLKPASPGMSFHKLAKARDKRFWSVRVGTDLRLIVHRTSASLLLCYVDHHDKAYAWADDEVVPLQARIEAVTDEADLGRYTTPSAICYTWLVPVRAITCS